MSVLHVFCMLFHAFLCVFMLCARCFNFVLAWRQSFLDSVGPRYLPPGWDLHRSIRKHAPRSRDAVELVARMTSMARGKNSDKGDCKTHLSYIHLIRFCIYLQHFYVIFNVFFSLEIF